MGGSLSPVPLRTPKPMKWEQLQSNRTFLSLFPHFGVPEGGRQGLEFSSLLCPPPVSWERAPLWHLSHLFFCPGRAGFSFPLPTVPLVTPITFPVPLADGWARASLLLLTVLFFSDSSRGGQLTPWGGHRQRQFCLWILGFPVRVEGQPGPGPGRSNLKAVPSAHGELAAPGVQGEGRLWEEQPPLTSPRPVSLGPSPSRV